MRIQSGLFQTGLILAVLLLTGCPAEPPKEGADGVPVSGVKDSAAQTSGLSDSRHVDGAATLSAEEAYRKDAIYDSNSPLSQQVIYFDFDDSTVREEYNELLVWHGRYLASNPEMKVRLEGHTDERGTREYNVALGERRAQAISRLLLFQGAKNDQVSTLSYGEEKPVALEHNEEAWRQNRRVQLVYEAK